MQHSRRLVLLLIALTACTSTPHPASPSPSPSHDAPTVARPTPNNQLTEGVSQALQKGDTHEAAAVVERAKRATGSAQPRADLIAYFDATVRSYQGDFAAATKILHDHIVQVGPAARAAFDFHDAMIALRTANGDVTGALVECDEMVRAGTIGTWKPSDMERMTLVHLKEEWHRAYLLRMLAQQRTGSERDAFRAYAERARSAYRELATPLGLGDSIAVLDAYFALCDGDRAAMHEAAARVNTAQDDDVEDLYLIQAALDGAGDRDAATALRTRILASPPITVLTPVFVAWMRSDDAADANAQSFSPRYPSRRARVDHAPDGVVPVQNR